ncbi:MAG TPA: protein kinase, partial [Isosphaeraceae bacterium]|nr:protein kinase [Isosphaeraceae bacterium]
MSDLQAGKEPDRSRLLADNPELASQLEACLAGIDFVHNATGSGAQEWTTLGEFRILREIGRGGMGVVYEAEQTSLRRRVALKVMRFGAVEDPEAIQRFLREAETVARLHHTNIVPIFAVGSERGVHFYAMQFIEGKSLAEVLAESQRAGKPLACADVTGWGLQAAEALAHAHLRGVVHRDIKPSNLLGDPEGIVWLTDFGLAKRADLATLTVRGALMGTPRYMSPEQAESIEHRVDRRTDLYSLGASLYELATGRPVFESAEPHLVIAQILNDEPIRPRQIRRDLPRDLETIILTCLSKEPGDRYQTASALADDLRSVLAGRPIRARRTTLSECVVRFIRKRRKALGVATRAVAATVLLIAGAALGWRSYADWRSGGVILTTDGPSLTAQVFAETGDEPVGEPFDVGRRTPLSLAAGDYRLRLNAPGLLGQTYRFAVNRGEVRTHRLTLDDEHAFESESLPYASESYALELAAGKGDIIEWNCETLIRRDGATAKVIWNARQPAKPWSPKLDPVDWLHRLSYYEDPTRPGDLVQPAPDLDRDGTNDLVWAIHGTPSFLALSGKDGSMLWTFSADPAGLGGPDPDGPRLPRSPAEIPRLGRIAGPPVLADVDRDGTPDLITEFVVYDDLKDSLSQSGQPIGQGMLAKIVPKPLGRRGVIAVSGRSGRGLWNYPLDQESTDDSQAARASDLALLCGRSGAFIMAVHRSLCISLDLATGRPKARPIDLGFVPTRPIQYADLDGDGAPELLAL